MRHANVCWIKREKKKKKIKREEQDLRRKWESTVTWTFRESQNIKVLQSVRIPKRHLFIESARWVKMTTNYICLPKRNQNQKSMWVWKYKFLSIRVPSLDTEFSGNKLQLNEFIEEEKDVERSWRIVRTGYCLNLYLSALAVAVVIQCSYLVYVYARVQFCGFARRSINRYNYANDRIELLFGYVQCS